MTYPEAFTNKMEKIINGYHYIRAIDASKSPKYDEMSDSELKAKEQSFSADLVRNTGFTIKNGFIIFYPKY